MNLKFILSTTFCTLVSMLCIAQTNIKGIVADKDTQESIGLANIALLKSDSTFVAGISSDEKGAFIFENIPVDTYILSTAFVGYEKLYTNFTAAGEEADLGFILLKSSDIALKDVTVTANAVIQKPDRKLIFPSQTQIKASSSGITLLRNLQLSRIIIDPMGNTISVPGGDAVQLRINGVEVTSVEVIALQPVDVIRIEYHDSPGMRYGNAAAVIDYIVRRKESGGNISTDLMNSPSDIGFAEDHFSVKYNNKKSEFGANVYWRSRDIDWVRQNDETYILPTETLKRVEQGVPTEFREKKLNLVLNYSLSEVDKYMFNATMRYHNDDSPSNYSNREGTLYTYNDPESRAISDLTASKSHSPSVDLYFQRNLKKDQLIIFNVVGTYIDSKSTRHYQEKRNGVPTTSILSDIEGEKYSLIAEGIYERKLGDGTFSMGIKHNQSYTNNIYDGNVAANIGLGFAETSAYSEYRFRKNKFDYNFSLGVVRLYNSQDGNNSQKYIFRPNFRINYSINDNAYVRYNGFVSGYPPSLSDLNNVTQAIDSLQIRQGNPNLKTVTYISNTINAGFNKGIFGVEYYIRYNYDRKPMMEQIDLKDGKFVRSIQNQKAFHRIQTEISLRLKPLDEYISLNITPGMNRYISLGNEYTHTYTNWYVRASLSASYKKWVLNVESNTRWNHFWAESLDMGERWNLVMVGYNTEKWGLTIGMMDPFTKTYKQSRRNYSSLVSSSSNIATDDVSRAVMLKFRLNFNFGRKFDTAGKRLDNTDKDAGIMSGSK